MSRAHTPDQPDWRILNAQGAVLDQLGRHAEAQRHYSAALKIVPNDPSVLSNLGLSYALMKDLGRAESTLRQAVARPNAVPKVRQNLALVVGLQGRFAEAETIAGTDLPPDEAAANVGYLRQMLAQRDDWTKKTGCLACPRSIPVPDRNAISVVSDGALAPDPKSRCTHCLCNWFPVCRVEPVIGRASRGPVGSVAAMTIEAAAEVSGWP